MIYSEWAFHDIEPIYLQLIKKIECAILSTQLSALSNMMSLGFSKEEATNFLTEYSSKLKEPNKCNH